VIETKKILCVEDDPDTAALIAEDLQERGYSVTIALNGQTGLAAILKSRPDLVLCDVSMPGMTGFELLERVTALPSKVGPVPFLFLTALVDRDTELKARRLGADDYVTKPIDFEMLSTIIEARLSHVARDRVHSMVVALKERELECLTWSARGKTSPEIAHILALSARTVDFHIENACRKLHVSTRIEAVAKAISERLIEP
jgi:DNA-binding NarL/FixJ family response regulator